MATNDYGFIPKKFIQPNRYELYFLNWNALYRAENGTVFMIEAQVYRYSLNRIGEKIETFDILVQRPDCRFQLQTGIKTFKEAVAIIERLLEKNSLPKQPKPVTTTQLSFNF